jgi:type IV pilus assembly protein PilP
MRCDELMKNYLASIRIMVVLMGLALLAASCEDSEPTAAQPQVVRKKIAAPADRTQPTSKAVAASRPNAEAPPSEPKPELAQAKPPEAREPVQTPAPKPQAPIPAAKTTEAAPAAAPRPTQQTPTAPDTQANTAGSIGRKAENALAVTDDQVAALLNIQAPPPYNPKGKPDPFEPFIRDEGQQVVKAMKPKKRTPQTPLEQIDLGQLKLVAIVASASGNRALVEESSGKGFILKPGTYVGLNSGKVVNITIEKVTIEEEYEDVYGKTITQKKEITLPKPPGEL